MILHVSPDGIPDGNPFQECGSLPDIQQAYDRLCALHQAGRLEGKSEILVHGGDYVLSEPLHFHGCFPVEIRPYGNDTVTISGGAPLKGWKKARINGRKAWRTTLPPSVSEVPFLYVNEKLATAARWPKSGFLRVVDKRSGVESVPEDCDSFRLSKGDFNPKWHDIRNISVEMIHLWIEEWLGIEDYDEANCRITTSNSIRYVADQGNTEVAFHNVREALSEPGEFYFDRQSHELWLITEDGHEPGQAVIPQVGTLARFDSGARWITLSDLVFRYGGTHRPLCQDFYDLRDKGFSPLPSPTALRDPRCPKPYLSAPQASCNVPGVLLFDHAEDCTLKGCSIRSCAWYGVQVARACRNLFILDNQLSDLGAGGILISGADYETVQKDPSLETSHLTIRGNHIHDAGQYFHAATGICLQHAWGCLIEGNHIHDLLYSGISAGWVWGYAPSITHDIRIHGNHIHDLGKGILSDMGGIYLLGVQPGSHVWENVIHGIENRYYGGWGLYADEGTSHVVWEKNLVYDCACDGYHQHYGRENIVRYNVLAFNGHSGMIVSADRPNGYSCPGLPHSCLATFHDNVILADDSAVIHFFLEKLYEIHARRLPSAQKAWPEGEPPVFAGGLYDLGMLFFDSNIAYDITRKKDVIWVEYGIKNSEGRRCRSLQEWQALGCDRHSAIADPGFRNPKARDFRLRKNSILRGTPFDFLDKVLE